MIDPEEQARADFYGRLQQVYGQPGTTSARTLDATLRPFATAAAARRSSMRELVQEPMNTLSTAMRSIGVPSPVVNDAPSGMLAPQPMAACSSPNPSPTPMRR